jgi:hypothetical protein
MIEPPDSHSGGSAFSRIAPQEERNAFGYIKNAKKEKNCGNQLIFLTKYVKIL